MRSFFVGLLLFVFLVPSAVAADPQQLGRCFLLASRVYKVDPYLLLAVAYVESSLRQEAVNYNRNGTVDLGIMQINSCWSSRIRNWHLVKDSACFNVLVGAWVLRQCIDTYGLNWDAVSCYNTGRGLRELSGSRRLKAELYVYRVYKTLRALKATTKGVGQTAYQALSVPAARCQCPGL
ncbi:MAG: lytic transglycosylase domain-containing protein [Thermofilaceae archaeon]